MTYRFFDHTGDVGVELTASDLGTLFADAAAALTDTVTDRSRVGTNGCIEVRIESDELELLLVDWLSELLFRFETTGWLSREVTATVTPRDEHWALHAVARGEAYDEARHPARVLVKAITYHGLSIHQSDTGATARVVFDI